LFLCDFVIGVLFISYAILCLLLNFHKKFTTTTNSSSVRPAKTDTYHLKVIKSFKGDFSVSRELYNLSCDMVLNFTCFPCSLVLEQQSYYLQCQILLGLSHRL